MNMYYLRGSRSGLFFVLGAGFTARSTREASQLTADQVTAARNLGFEPSTTVNVGPTSFAVNYIRQADLDARGQVRPNANNPSRRRFATRKEANQHGSRFYVRKAKGSNVEGSAGHIGFYVTESNDPVNAEINWATGLTNSM